MVNDVSRPEDANYKVEMNSLKNTFENGGGSGKHYQPSYDSVSINHLIFLHKAAA